MSEDQASYAVPTLRISTPKLAMALAKAQAEFQPIAKNRDVQITMRSGGAYKFRYADLEAILTATRPALNKNGLSIITEVNDGQLITILMHESGDERRSTFNLPSADDIKAYGAQISYLRRYAITALLGVAADDDLDEDGQEAGDAPVPAAKPEKKAPPAARPMYADADFKEKLPAWKDLILSGKKTPADIIKMVSTRYELAVDQIEVLNNIKAEEQAA